VRKIFSVPLNLIFIGFITGLTGAMLPGPLLAFAVTTSVKNKRNIGVEISLGHLAVELPVVYLIYTGVLHLNRFGLKVVTVIGAFGLIFLGISAIRAKEERRKIRYSGSATVGGAFFTFFNPGFPLWWGIVGMPLIARASMEGVIGVILLISGHATSDIMWYALISEGTVRAKFKEETYKKLLKILGTMLIVYAAYLLYKMGCITGL